jgi:hypothetical protein
MLLPSCFGAQKLAEQGDLNWLTQHEKVYAADDAA